MAEEKIPQKPEKKLRLSSEANKKVAVPHFEERAREKQQVLSQGAEAKILLDQGEELIIKERIPKNYRNKELDKKLRKRRTKSETKIMIKASEIINVPSPLDKPGDNFSQLRIPYIEGKKLSENLDKLESEKQKEISEEIGKSIAKLHKNSIIHGDLTTSNMILKEDKVFLIDFGLGFFSDKTEDQAVDLHLLKQALEAKHFKNWQELYSEVQKGYIKSYGKEQADEVFKRIEKVEKRGRYKH